MLIQAPVVEGRFNFFYSNVKKLDNNKVSPTTWPTKTK
jgi:hypothetical protein